MIQIYKAGNTNYTKNGDMVLTPSVAEVSAEINSTWSAKLEHPVDEEGRWQYIQEDAVIKMPSFNGEQLFRIKSKTKTESTVTATAEPIFMDAMDDCFLVDVRPTAKTGKQALDLMVAPAGGKYTAESDIDTKATAYYEFKNLIEAINGSDDNSFLSRWGGEILFDNFKIIINKQIGQDRGVELRYGKNIPVDGMSEEVDLSNVVTRIYPKGYNGVKLSGSGYVDSPLKAKYATVKARVISFDDVKMEADASEDDTTNGTTICKTQAELDAALKKKCNEQFEAGLDKPTVTLSADMVLLADTEQYKDYTMLEEVSLGDTIKCVNSRLDIDTTARVVSLVYDSIGQKVQSVVIGQMAYNYFNNVSSVLSRVDTAIKPDGTVKGEQIQGFLDAAKARLRAQSTVAKRQGERAILFEDLDPSSPTYGAMCIGTQGFEISDTRNTENTDWVWSTFGTGKGFNADLINAGMINAAKVTIENLSADNITAGTLNADRIPNISADKIASGTLILGGANNDKGSLKILDANGNPIGTWDNSGINATKGSFEGKVTANSGTIGGWNITGGKIYGGDSTTGTAVMQRPQESTTYVFAAGGKDHTAYSDCPFRVTKDGDIYCQRVHVGAIYGEFGKEPYANLTSDIDKITITTQGYLYNEEAEDVVGNILSKLNINQGKIIMTGTILAEDWSGETRRPVGSTTVDGRRVANISSSTATNFTIYGQGNVTGGAYNGYNVTCSSSDIRLKENIKATEVISALDTLKQITLHSFDWKDRKNDEKHQTIGFIADELEELDPNLAIGGGYDEDGTMNVKGVDTFYLLGYVVKAIQELSERLDKIEREKA